MSGEFEFGNKTQLGDVDGVVYDDSQLSREEAEAAVANGVEPAEGEEDALAEAAEIDEIELPEEEFEVDDEPADPVDSE